jgi:cytochrome c oxidase subunit 2
MRMTSRDVIHSFYLPDFKVKEDSMPGRVTYLWFYPKEPGEHIITCAEFCGVLHSNMRGTVIAMPEDEFNKWLAEEKANLEEGGA